MRSLPYTEVSRVRGGGSTTSDCKWALARNRRNLNTANCLTAFAHWLIRSVDAWATSCTLPAHAHKTPHSRKTSKSNNFINMGSIKEALNNLRSQEKPNILQTAKKHNVDRITLLRRWNKVTRLKRAGYDVQRLLTTAQSNSLINYINDLTERALPPINIIVRNFAAEII
jgi:hypothetical protein